MAMELSTPTVAELPDIVEAMRPWQLDDAPIQLHPGDVAWHWRLGAETVAAALRTWRLDGRLVAVGFLDGPGLVRTGVDPEHAGDEGLARTIADDVADPARGLLAEGAAAVEVTAGTALSDALLRDGWREGPAWAALRRDLTDPVEDPGIAIEVVGPGTAAERVELQRASFDVSRFTLDQWHTLAASPPYADAACLLARDADGTAVAAASVWSAGPGRPGLIEPLGAHRNHRGRGYGRAITLACAAHLRELGASSVLVKTEGHNAAGVGAYRSAGLTLDPPAPDLVRG
ncbi:GNAT family N-acetyltransferase [Georgenia sp. Z1344]|uniref:GNAT family N-acetyltransferase n=1 Tax=Georgenia sp. Z1344 TaxID=3416706 RepID=UPI003CEC551F